MVPLAGDVSMTGTDQIIALTVFTDIQIRFFNTARKLITDFTDDKLRNFLLRYKGCDVYFHNAVISILRPTSVDIADLIARILNLFRTNRLN